MANFENPSALIKVQNLAFSMILSLININNFSNPPSRRGCFHSFCCYFLLMFPLINQFEKYYVLRTYHLDLWIILCIFIVIKYVSLCTFAIYLL